MEVRFNADLIGQSAAFLLRFPFLSQFLSLCLSVSVSVSVSVSRIL